MAVFGGPSLDVSLKALEGLAAPAGPGSGCPDPARLNMPAQDLITGLVISALEPSLGEIEWLDGVPVRDDLQFKDQVLPGQARLHAWLYAPGGRVAMAVHAPNWTAPQTMASQRQARQNWDALLREHLHASSGQGWSELGAVAMPVRPPFDEPGLKLWPLLALWAPVSCGETYLSETKTASVRHGGPAVIGVRVFSAALYIRALLDEGRSSVRINTPHSSSVLPIAL